MREYCLNTDTSRKYFCLCFLCLFRVNSMRTYCLKQFILLHGNCVVLKYTVIPLLLIIWWNTSEILFISEGTYKAVNIMIPSFEIIIDTCKHSILLLHFDMSCRKAMNHYINQWWTSSMMPYGVPRQQWSKTIRCWVLYLLRSTAVTQHTCINLRATKITE